MKKDAENKKTKVVEEPVVIPDECGDSMWDTVLEQSAFVQVLRQAAKAVPEDKKAKEV